MAVIKVHGGREISMTVADGMSICAFFVETADLRDAAFLTAVREVRKAQPELVVNVLWQESLKVELAMRDLVRRP